MSEQELKIAVVGLGKMGVMHAAMCHAVEGCQVAALVDRDTSLGGQVRSMGCEAPVFGSVAEAVAAVPGLDAAIIATPQFTHRAIAVECLEAGLHVFCEKPLAHTLDEARALARAARAHSDRVCAVGFMKGHYPLWREAARRMRSGWIGTPRRFSARVYLSQVMGPMKGWTFTRDKAGGGFLINSGIHLVQLLRLLFGDARRAHALARPMHSQVEDSICALIEYDSGVFGCYDASWSVPGHPTESTTVLVEGDAGTMEISDDWLRTHHLNGRGEAPRGWSQTHRAELDEAAFTLSPDYGGEGYYNQIRDFVRAVRGSGRPLYDFQEGLAVQRVVDALYRSVEQQGPVEIEPED